MMRGTVWITADDPDTGRTITWQIVQVDTADTPEAFKAAVESGQSTVPPQLAGASVEYGPIGPPWHRMAR